MVRFKGQEYDSIDTFDCVVLSFSNHGGGAHLACVPISGKEYRESKPTRASVNIVTTDSSTRFDIRDDWGNPYSVDIDSIHQEEIEHATNAAWLKGLLKEEV